MTGTAAEVGVPCWLTGVVVTGPGGAVVGDVGGAVVGGTVTGTEVEPCSPIVVVVVDSMQVGVVVVVVEPCSPIVVVVVDSQVVGIVVLVEPCSPIVVVVVDSMQLGVVVVGAAVVVVGAAVVVVGGALVVVEPCSPIVVVVVDAWVVVVQSDIRSTDVCSVSVTPSLHVPNTRNVIVPVLPNGTVVVAYVVWLSGTGDS